MRRSAESYHEFFWPDWMLIGAWRRSKLDENFPSGSYPEIVWPDGMLMGAWRRSKLVETMPSGSYPEML